MRPIQSLMHILSSALRSPRDLPASGEEGGTQSIKAQQRLRELKRDHGHEVTLFCAHDVTEFEALA